MKVILLQDSKDLGKKGAVLNVSDGYARNFLIAKGLAVEASESAMRTLQEDQKRESAKAKKLLDDAKNAASRIKGKTVTVVARAGGSGRLFGSVTAQDVSTAIQTQLKVAVDKRRLTLDQQIKTIGLYSATLKLHPEVEVSVDVKVVSEEERM